MGERRSNRLTQISENLLNLCQIEITISFELEGNNLVFLLLARKNLLKIKYEI